MSNPNFLASLGLVRLESNQLKKSSVGSYFKKIAHLDKTKKYYKIEDDTEPLTYDHRSVDKLNYLCKTWLDEWNNLIPHNQSLLPTVLIQTTSNSSSCMYTIYLYTNHKLAR